MADSGGNIFIEADFDNIFSINPNKIYDEFGNVQERLVNHEELVMYVNLECNLLPRTKLQIGNGGVSDNVTIATNRINFMNPGQKNSLDTSWTDAFVGSNILKGDNLKNAKPGATNDSKQNEKFEENQTQLREGSQPTTDTALLGITAINYKINSSFLPEVTMVLEDIKGKALFESGDQSPYSVFFQMPYPIFYLTMKGWYGKAIRVPLQLVNFNSSFNSQSGNFNINLKFYGYRYSMISEIPPGSLVALPHMYERNFTKQTTENPNASTQTSETITTTLGYDCIKNIYAKYKSKGLIDKDFPEYTVMEFIDKLDQFQNNIAKTLNDADYDKLTQIQIYADNLSNLNKDLFTRVSTTNPSWASKYRRTLGPTKLILKPMSGDEKENVKSLFFYKVIEKEKAKQTDEKAREELSKILLEYKQRFDNLSLFKDLTFNINQNDFYFTNPVATDSINWEETFRENFKKAPSGNTDPEFVKFINDVTLDITLYNNCGEKVEVGQNGIPNNQDCIIYLMNYDKYEEKFQKLSDGYSVIKEDTRKKIAQSILESLKSKETGIGFLPTIRNITAILYASVEGFIELMDRTHTAAWSVRDDSNRKKIVRNSKSPVDIIDNNTDPVYPWPQIVEETPQEEGEIYTIKYPGDYPNCRDSSIWPEVKFVEEFIKGVTQRNNTINNPSVNNQNQLNESGLVSIDTLDYPITSAIYLNKEEAKFIYEIWERCFLLAFYTRLSKTNDGNIYKPIAEFEVNNIVKSLEGTSLSLKSTLKNYKIDSRSIVSILQNISNNGLGPSWQNFIRERFNTEYLLGNLQQSVIYLTTDELYNVNFSSDTENNIISYLNSTTTNKPDLFDTFPFINEIWLKNNLSNGITTSLELANNTNRTIIFNKEYKTITSFSGTTDLDIKKPVLNFKYRSANTLGEGSYLNIKDFYTGRSPKDYIPCEGYLNYDQNIGYLSTQIIGPQISPIQKSTSIFNTPIFINSILTANNKFRNRNFYPFLVPAYLFLNSLPIATLREKMKTKDGLITNDLDYVFSTLKKFSAIHSLPYAWILKYGSIWHRYKTWVETGNDILTNDWSDFQYAQNYDPTNSDPTRHYNLNIVLPSGSQQAVDIVLQENNNVGTNIQTVINLGFYPNLIDEYNVCYQGIEVIKSGFTYGYPNTLIDNSLFTKDLILLKSDPTNSARDNRMNPIFRNPGFDSNNPTRTLSINTWSALSTKLSATTQTQECFVLPSFGTMFNETIYECFKENANNPYNPMGIEVTGNTSMFNGSVRLMWGAPNYGYFNLSGITKPTPEEYMKSVFSATSEQANFGFQKSGYSYSNISDIFGVFDTKVLDFFEQEFLNFCRSIYDVTSIGDGENFQDLFRSLMTIQKPNGNTTDQIIQDVIRKQNSNAYSKISQFLDTQKIIKLGNVSNFDRRIFFSFANTSSTRPIDLRSTRGVVIEDQYEYFPYQDNLPPNISLAASLSNSPSAWAALRTNVGFSDISGLTYNSTGSYITDFFIDMDIEFTESNVKNLSQLIKIYATQKLLDPTLNKTKFIQILREAIYEIDEFKNGIIDALFSNKRFLNSLDTTESNTSSDIDINKEIDSPSIKVELWELFKAINDKWVSGGDFQNKTFFEDVLFLDRASRDVGQKVIVDIPEVTGILKGKFKGGTADDKYTDFSKANLMAIINSIITKSRFVIMPISGFMNFFGVPSPTKNAKPKVDDPLDFANSLFGTYLEVDTRESASKMVCYYANKPSEHLKLNEKTSYYKNDSWNFNLPTNNPLRNTPTKDYGLQNKVIGFVVDFGIQNQNVFYDISLNQTPGKPTSETIQALTDLANQGSGRGAESASVSLYNVYKTRSYQCEITMFGNVMVQPLMYFILRHVPMFEGPYLIIDVSHDIRPGTFSTKLVGVRQPIPAFKDISVEDAILKIQSAYLTDIEKEISKNLTNNKPVTPEDIPSKTTDGTNNFIIDSFLGRKQKGNNCETTLNGEAKSYSNTDTIETTISPQTLSEIIRSVVTNGNEDVKKLVYSLVWLESTSGGPPIKGFNNNFIGLPLNIPNIDTYLKNNTSKINKTYSCIRIEDDTYAIANFVSEKACIEVAVAKFQELVKGDNVNLTEEKVTDLLIENYPIKAQTGTNNAPNPQGSQTIKTDRKSDYDKILTKVKQAFISAKSVNLFDLPASTPPAPSSGPPPPPLPSPTPQPTPPPTPTPPITSNVKYELVIDCQDCSVPLGDGNQSSAYINIKKSNGRYVIVRQVLTGSEFKLNNVSFGRFYRISQPPPNNSPVTSSGYGPPKVYEITATPLEGQYIFEQEYFDINLGTLKATITISI